MSPARPPGGGGDGADRPGTPRTRRAALDELRAARARSDALFARVDDETLVAQHSPLMSPMVWDRAHVANYEELWLVRALGGAPVRDDLDDLYDALRHPRATRPGLPTLDPAQTVAYAAAVRAEVLRIADRLDAGDDPASPTAGVDRRLLAGGFVHAMVAQHEQQHLETVTATLQLVADPGLRPDLPARRERAPGVPPAGAEVVVPAGPFTMGTDDAWAYDNERPAHERHVDAFAIDVHPVTNAAHLAFLADGSYERPELWSEAGWAWRTGTAADAPLGWERVDPTGPVGDPTSWQVVRFGHRVPLDPDEPVQHVCWYEADAHARWAGRRLPTEAEWEKAAAHDPATGSSRPWPWGHDAPDRGPDEARANLGGHRWGPDPVGTRPAGASAHGVHGLVGDVWEWTATEFGPHPGFAAFPYREYSEVFHDDGHRVLRGGSWAADPVAVRTTFRNWDLPIRRQVFVGFRTARDA